MTVRIPYLHALGAGVHLNPEAVTWVSLRRSGDTLAVAYQTAEPVVAGDVDAALRRLLERVPAAMRPGGGAPLVAARLDALLGRTALLDAPEFDEPDLRDAWLRSEAARLLPPGCRTEDFALRVQPIGEDPHPTRLLLNLARLTSVDAAEHRFADAGYRLVRLTLPETDLLPLLVRLPSFTEGCTAALTLRPADATLLIVRDGRLDALHHFLADDPQGPGDALLHAARACLTDSDDRPVPSRLFVVGPEAATRRAQSFGLIDGPVLPARLSLPGCADGALTGAALEAAALALGAVQPAAGANLLPSETVRIRRQALEKAEAVRAIGGIGGILALVFGLLWLAQTAVGLALERSDHALSRLADRLAEIETARAEIDRLETDVREAGRLSAAQTHSARVLESVARAAPPEVWLERIRIEPAGADTLHVNLTGVALHEGPVAVYLDRLERTGSTETVRLLLAESVLPGRLYPDVDALRPGPVTRFEIAVRRPAVSFFHASAR